MAVTSVGPRQLSGMLAEWQAGASSLYDALSDGIENLIRSGELPPDTRLPSERGLADQLAVSRGTVAGAYEQLRERGLVATRHGSGTVVLAEGSPVSGPREAHVTTTLRSDSLFRGFLSLDDDVIDLRGAYWLGTEDLSEAPFERAFQQLRAERQGHGYQLLGIPALRAAIAAHMTRTGLETTPEEILVTTGAQQAIALVTQLLVGSHDAVAVEEVTYSGAVEVFLAQQARVVPVSVGRSGLELPSLAAAVRRHGPRVAYLVPSVNNPTGTVLPSPARARLAELAARWDSTIIVDDRTLADTQWEEPVPAPLAAYADESTADRIVTIGSLSKVFWSGLRIGWVRAAPRLLSRLARLKSVLDMGTPVASQLIAANLLEQCEDTLPVRRRSMVERMEALSAALKQRIPEWSWSRPAGGLCLWVDLGGASATEFCHVAMQHGVSVVPGTVVSAVGAHDSHLRLPFGQPPDVLEEAVDRLSAAWRDHSDRLECCRDDNLSVVV